MVKKIPGDMQARMGEILTPEQIEKYHAMKEAQKRLGPETPAACGMILTAQFHRTEVKNDYTVNSIVGT